MPLFLPLVWRCLLASRSLRLRSTSRLWRYRSLRSNSWRLASSVLNFCRSTLSFAESVTASSTMASLTWAKLAMASATFTSSTTARSSVREIGTYGARRYRQVNWPW